jgi:hypothetical protein
MLEHLSPKFKMPPMEREPRAALILNRFTRSLNIMYATDVVTQILGLSPGDLVDRPFYDCIQPNCLEEAERCLESAKANESIAYLRFWYKDPRVDLNDTDNEEEEVDESDDESDQSSSSSETQSEVDFKEPQSGYDGMDVDGDHGPEPGAAAEDIRGGRSGERPGSRSRVGSLNGSTRDPQVPQTFELEAVVSCTSDGLVVVLRRARPPIPDPQPTVAPATINYENGLFAAPWGYRPIEPYMSPELLYTFRPPLLPEYMPLREGIKAAGGPPLDRTYCITRVRPIYEKDFGLITADRADEINPGRGRVCMGGDWDQRYACNLWARSAEDGRPTGRWAAYMATRLGLNRVPEPKGPDFVSGRGYRVAGRTI